MMRRAAIAAALLALAGCEGIGFSQLDTESAAGKEKSAWFGNYYGTPAKEESDWWGGFYGTGGSTGSCDFYGSCPKSGGSEAMQGGGGMWGAAPAPASDTGGSDTGGGW